ncbi:hypothetical protein BC936DRAFT_147058 [Jimgerdemannia flammicorona]|uniref:B30.2/SPRY domain-containing protein n=1 Tax=Jimgerdemannia flammicorona TaxID=994334 RepID=A0A433D6B8_9FUNG|nr:hypothetical protein BC936DRAFT_147058 [Jimgerdemannia flammicorona]
MGYTGAQAHPAERRHRLGRAGGAAGWRDQPLVISRFEVRVDRLVIFDFCVGCGSGLDGIVFCIRATIVIDLLVGLLDRGFNSHRVLHAGQNKQKIMSHPLNIRYIMANIIADLDSQQHRHRRRQQQIQQKPTLLPSSPTTLPPLHGLHQRRLSMRRFSLPKVRERSHETSDGGSGPTESDVIQENIVEEPTELRVHAEVETARKLADGHEEQTGDHHARASVYAGLVGSVKARDEQFRVRQLRFCTEWALKNSFGSYDETAASTTPASNTKDINVMMNTLDATPHWKMTEDGLEIRNDHSTFESIRATMSVMSGKWYYEVTLLTGGIMQIGWATRRCRFGPEDGTGVGDDDYGFGFDGCRNVIWSSGSSLFPPSPTLSPCRAGDVIGSLLDLDAGNCTFYVNGRDIDIVIEFDKAQMRRFVGDPIQQHFHHHSIGFHHGRMTDHVPHSRRHTRAGLFGIVSGSESYELSARHGQLWKDALEVGD